MQFFRSLSRGLLILVISLVLALWIILATSYTTLMQRQVVLGWFNASGAYENIVDSVVRLLPTQGSEQQFLGEQTIRQAINNTLPPAFIKQTTETILNASYDWLEGKTQEITFTIPLNDKRPVLQKELTAAILPQIEALPVCGSQFSGLASETVSCRPQSTSAASMSEDLARRAVESTDFLTQPLTPQTFKDLKIPAVGLLRWVVQLAPTLVFALPVFVLVCALVYVLLYDQKIVGLRVVGRRVFFSTILAPLAAGLLWVASKQLSLRSFGDQAIVAEVIDPLFRLIIADISMWLFIFSGSVLLVSGATWLTAHLIEKQQNKNKLPVLPQQPTAHPTNLPPPASLK